jgi:hypothetical protein
MPTCGKLLTAIHPIAPRKRPHTRHTRPTTRTPRVGVTALEPHR